MIVSNATPLIYLSKIGKLGLLKRVFGEVYIPEEVKREAVDRGKELKKGDTLVIEKAIEDGWLKVSKAEPIESPIELEPGETAAISLAKKLGGQEVLIDEVSARTAARLLGLKPKGTVLVLLKTLEEGEMNLDEFLETMNDLVEHGFRLREEVYIEAIRKAREIEEAKS
ncbi:hypothetical protein AKJ42_03495 [candidate division MSBL1 archaeon SCGC-AAA261C02]|uniref:DUF3368 domain-containing protein n=1 Tax=candidate division MSBL1 archaeon SCGC-AAA261C02 TaxID=1698272 RepID=A0A133UYJ4_9EURY|nr:hypothetical protein AKJ42_03495 [candidate division MSBL1 archaeon SCGC-AAA261C02]